MNELLTNEFILGFLGVVLSAIIAAYSTVKVSMIKVKGEDKKFHNGVNERLIECERKCANCEAEHQIAEERIKRQQKEITELKKKISHLEGQIESLESVLSNTQINNLKQ